MKRSILHKEFMKFHHKIGLFLFRLQIRANNIEHLDGRFTENFVLPNFCPCDAFADSVLASDVPKTQLFLHPIQHCHIKVNNVNIRSMSINLTPPGLPRLVNQANASIGIKKSGYVCSGGGLHNLHGLTMQEKCQ